MLQEPALDFTAPASVTPKEEAVGLRATRPLNSGLIVGGKQIDFFTDLSQRVSQVTLLA
jgi:hypothetical protein